jgi:glucose/arabinose dehydrogenase
MRSLVPFAVLLAACKGDAPRAEKPRPDTAVTVAPARVIDAGAALPPPVDLPAPSEDLTDAPADIAGSLALVELADDLSRPVLVTFAPGDPRKRLFVVEQVGRIRWFEDGKLASGVFLDISKKVSRDNEQGLLGLAFHPKFADNQRLFIYYTAKDDDVHIVEYQVSSTNPDKVDPATARELIEIAQPYSNHNGGHLQFGPDGKLYAGVGDGGAAGDPLKAGQDPDQLLAKLLRWDVDAAQPTTEIVALGLRNPWRFDFDPETGDLYIGDVGQNAWEMVYAVEAGTIDGRNFGWSVSEGRHCYERKRCDMEAFTSPVTDYPHPDGCSVTGGIVYRGAALPALDGVYFYADYCMGWIRSFRWRPDGIRQHWDWRPALDPDSKLTQVSSFGRDADGELYVLSLSGSVFKLARRD